VVGATLGDLGGALGGEDAIVARVDGGGNVVWLRQFGTPQWEEALAVIGDGSGGYFIAGLTEGNLGGPSAGEDDVFLTRVDSSGAEIWMRQFGAAGPEAGEALAPDDAGGVYVVGGAEDLGGDADVFVARYDAAGSQMWLREFGSPEFDIAFSAATDGAGGVYIAGSTQGVLGASSAGANDVFVARYDPSGARLWLRQFGTAEIDDGAGLSPDGAGGVYLVGRTFGALSGTNAGFDDAFVTRYDADGSRLWLEQFGTSASDIAIRVDPGPAGGVVGGMTSGAIGGPSAGGVDVFLTSFDAGGAIGPSTQAGSSGADVISGLVTIGSRVMVAGETTGVFGGAAYGLLDAFVGAFGCYADCDANGSLDVFDFLCFQDAFVSTAPYADCDGNSSFDVFDFLCFQDAFVTGCP
jgi:hypothetical protein